MKRQLHRESRAAAAAPAIMLSSAPSVTITAKRLMAIPPRRRTVAWCGAYRSDPRHAAVAVADPPELPPAGDIVNSGLRL
jgi:hypothetical protein